jgi:hypothetical protein
MSWREIDLNPLLKCCQRELAFRERVYPRMVANGKISEKKAQAEIELMRDLVQFMIHCVFCSVARRRSG